VSVCTRDTILPNYRKLFADLKPGHQDPIKHDHTLDGSRFQKKIKRSYKKRKSKASKLKPVAKNRNRNHTRALLVLSLSRPAPDLFLSPRETGQFEISFCPGRKGVGRSPRPCKCTWRSSRMDGAATPSVQCRHPGHRPGSASIRVFRAPMCRIQMPRPCLTHLCWSKQPAACMLQYAVARVVRPATWSFSLLLPWYDREGKGEGPRFSPRHVGEFILMIKFDKSKKIELFNLLF
jgi:hypothetical protein